MTAYHSDIITVRPRNEETDVESQLNDVGKQITKMFYSGRHLLKGKTVEIEIPCPPIYDKNTVVELCHEKNIKEIYRLRACIRNIARHATYHGIIIRLIDV